jgi:hypothetical protein
MPKLTLRAEYYGGPRYLLEDVPRSIRVTDLADQVTDEARRDLRPLEASFPWPMRVEHLLDGERRSLSLEQTLLEAGLRNGDEVVVASWLVPAFVRLYDADALRGDAFRCGLPAASVPPSLPASTYVKRTLFELDCRGAFADLLALALVRWPEDEDLKDGLALAARLSPVSQELGELAPRAWPLLRDEQQKILERLWEKARAAAESG